jgi:recombination protein RecT
MAVANSLATKQQKTGLTAYLTQDAVKNQINSIIGGKNGTKFIASIVSAVQNNSTLQECTNPSILSAALLGESLNLSPSPQLGQYYLVPFNDKEKGKVAQFQLGYKGYIQLAIRSGQYKKLNVLSIKEGELIRFNPLEEEIEVRLIDDEEERENAVTVGYYTMFEYTNGFKKAIYWSRKKMEAHAKKFSQGYKKDLEKGWSYTFWSKDFDGMAYKTMLRQLISKWGVMSIEMQQAIDADMAVINEDGTKSYVDNEENIIDQEVVETKAEETRVEETKAEETKVEETAKETAEATSDVQEAFFN